ncbi:signal peptidase II [Mucilaginibacter ginsenosidivorax]|uniref:Lipoprotein signal peptidase n=1 Tax=Mucilaginibacter ginsenosidivorax TaxID=862126 RepID=A0A5B8W8S3_9SPHI|nr:signal peptidase II [Mucilaginibacter ginsenosidivorax]QEC78648.1 signal peptidase II [Mucilaginibacter ginsenosidivorax]
MDKKRVSRGLWLLLLLALVIGADRISKIYVRDHIHFAIVITVVKNFLTISRVENTGAFLSMGDKLPNPWHFILLSVLPAAALAWGLLYVLLKRGLTLLNQAGIIVILAGGIGNLYDRAVYGSVTDFAHMNFGLFETGIFNIADVAIMVGVGMLLLNAFMREREQKRQAAAGKAVTA